MAKLAQPRPQLVAQFVAGERAQDLHWFSGQTGTWKHWKLPKIAKRTNLSERDGQKEREGRFPVNCHVAMFDLTFSCHFQFRKHRKCQKTTL